MFIQVLQGAVADADGLQAALQRWSDELRPGAAGWLGTTAGVTDDGVFIALVRFESEEAARRNSDRAEQDAWWRETAKLFGGEVTFHDCRDVFLWLGGGSDDAGFVQVLQYRTSDPQRLRELTEVSVPSMREHRPDIIGGTTALHGDGGVTEAVYFTSEAAAREGERKELRAELQAQYQEQMDLLADITYYDLRRPWLRSG